MYNDTVATVEELVAEVERLEQELDAMDPTDPYYEWFEDNLRWWREELELAQEV